MRESNEQASKLAISEGVDTDFSWLNKESLDRAINSKNAYTHSSMLCYYAVMCCNSKKTVTGVQLDMGNGKSFLVILCAHYLKNKCHKKVVITSINKCIIKQLKDKARDLNIYHLEFDDETRLHHYLYNDYIILYDEYPWSIDQTKYSINARQQPNSVCLAGRTGRMIFFTGSTS